MRLQPGTSRFRSARAWILALGLVATWATLAGCSSDGGISGTGTGDELLGQGASEPMDAVVPVPPGAAPDEATPEQSFENDRAAYPGITPYLRAVNLSARAVTVSVDGTERLELAPAGTNGTVPDAAIGLAAVDPGNDLFSVAADGDAAPAARIGVERLRPGSLTTLLVQEAGNGGLVLTPLVTLATPPNDGTALVRVSFAAPADEAAAFAATLSLAPGAGGAATRFPAGGQRLRRARPRRLLAHGRRRCRQPRRHGRRGRRRHDRLRSTPRGRHAHPLPADPRQRASVSPRRAGSVIARLRASRTAASGTMLCLLLLAGGCDGGLFGTGDSSDDASAGPAGPIAGVPGDANADAGEADVTTPDTAVPGTSDGEGEDGQDGDAAPGTEPMSGIQGGNDETPGNTFSNTLATGPGETPLLRTVNLTGSAVNVVPTGRDGASLEAGGIGDAVPVDLGAGSIAVFDAITGDTLADLDVSLGASTLTTLLVLPPDGRSSIAVVPLVTRIATEGDAVALVRVVDGTRAAAGSASALEPLELRPAGENAATAIDIAAPDGDALASPYVSAAPGDYLLDVEGGSAGVPVSLAAGETVSLMLVRPDRTRTDDVVRVLDSDVD